MAEDLHGGFMTMIIGDYNNQALVVRLTDYLICKSVGRSTTAVILLYTLRFADGSNKYNAFIYDETVFS